MTSWKKQRTLSLTRPPVSAHILLSVLLRYQKRDPIKKIVFLQDDICLIIDLISCVHLPTSCALQNKAESTHYNSKINSAKEEKETPDPDFVEKQFAIDKEQTIIDMNNIRKFP